MLSTQPYSKVRPVADDDERGDREDDTGRDRGRRRGAGLHDIVFQDVATAKSVQHRHRSHRRRDRGGYRQPREQSEIGVRGGEDHRQYDGKRYRADAQLRRSLGAR